MTDKANGERCACGRRVRAERWARVGMCATCERVGDGRAAARTSDAARSDRPADARILWGACGVYGDAQRPCAHRGVCRHAPRTDVGIAYVWNARRGAYDYTPVGQTVPIPTHKHDATPHVRSYIGARAGVCERCDLLPEAHVDGGACTYRPRVDAIAGDARAFTVDDVDAYLKAFKARTRTNA
jgi:hypothetical protein